MLLSFSHLSGRAAVGGEQDLAPHVLSKLNKDTRGASRQRPALVALPCWAATCASKDTIAREISPLLQEVLARMAACSYDGFQELYPLSPCQPHFQV